MKRASALIFAVILLFTLSSCNNTRENNSAKPTDTDTLNESLAVVESDKILKLAYSASDSFNPFTARSVNNQSIMTLLFDPLYAVDEKYNSVGIIAKASSNDDTLFSVTIKDGVTFTDGTPLTAADVLYSFNKAKASGSFAASLSNFSYAAIKNSVITFSLKQADAFAANCLTFPIVKNKTADTGDLPIGSGRYILDASSNVLNANSANIRGEAPGITSITLVNIYDTASLINSLQIGNISYSFQDLSSGSYTRINAGTKNAVLNNLVYMGVNSSSKLLSNADLVKAVNSAVNRESIATSAYQGHACVAFTPFNPQWRAVEGLDASTHLLKSEEINKLLDNAGYGKKNALGFRTSGNEAITLRLLVNSGNFFKVETANLISKNLAEFGINVEIKSVSFNDYKYALSVGNFDLYIGEIRLPDNHSLMPFFDTGGEASFGIKQDNAVLTDAYKSFSAGGMTAADFMSVFNASLPFIPLCYRYGVNAYSRELKENMISTQSDNFYNISQWSFN